MELINTDIEGPVILQPRVFDDSRGYFFESFSQAEFERLTGACGRFVQDNESCSRRGVIRGLHFQRPPFAQAKLLRCVSGAVIDVAVDLRKGSPTYGRHVAVELSAANRRQLYVPRGFAHGFAVLSDTAVCLYKCDAYYNPQAEDGISALDPTLGIDWRVDLAEAILSPKDLTRPGIDQFNSPFSYGKA